MKKISNKKGFSLAEVLVAVLIMAMVTSVVATGMPTAINAYRKIVDTANGQLLLTTTVNALRNELDLARDIGVSFPESTVIDVEYKTTIGTQSRISFKTGDKINLTEYIAFHSTSDPGTTRPLVSDAAASRTMNVEVSGVNLQDGYIYLTGLTVKKGSNTIVQPADYVIKLMN